jgi:gentisate 1,2-dioxygenase
MTSIAPDEATAGMKRFNERLNTVGLRIQQPDDVPVFTREPASAMTPMHWAWSDLAGLIDELSEHLTLSHGSGRRTLKLTNPGLERGTTPTFWASIQFILPGEVATAHRHTPSAFRFVMSGHGCRTTVDGENYEMKEGDLVLTPSWAWHDHVHEGEEPMIWLDVLDISLVSSLGSIFFEDYGDDVQPVDVFADAGYRRFGSGLLRPVGPPSRAVDNPLLAYP